MRVLTLAHREWASYFRSSIGWLVMALYLALSGFWFAFGTLVPGEPASMRFFFGASQWVLLLIVPAVSMRLFADEKRSGTFEVLMTAPVSDWAVVAGKFAGGAAFLLTMFAPTLLFVGVLEVVADPEYGAIVCGYVGLVLVSLLYLSAGTLLSALTENQVVASVGTMFLFVGWELVASQGGKLLGPPWDGFLLSLSVVQRAGTLAKGVIDSGDVVAFIAASGWFLVLTVVSLEFRRWK